MKKLTDKVAVVTGGNSGIGLATAKLFAECGVKVAITGRNASSLEDARKEIGKDAIALQADVTDVSSIENAYAKIHSGFGKIDVLVVNAGVAIAGTLEDYTEQQFDQTSAANFKGAFFSVQKALRYLNDGAAIVLVSSATNEKGFAGYAAYAATKAAIRSLARSFSGELLSRGIRVNVVSPGAIDTPLYGRGGGTADEIAAAKAYMAANMIPAKRLGTAEEVAEAILYLSSDEARYIVGAELVIDGGVKTL